MPRLATLLALLVSIVSVVIFFLPPPAGATPLVMHAAALMLFTVGLWATGVVPEYVTSLLFFLLAVLLAVLEAFLARRFSYATGAHPITARQPNTQQVVSGGVS